MGSGGLLASRGFRVSMAWHGMVLEGVSFSGAAASACEVLAKG